MTESIVACAVLACGADDVEKPPPIMRDISDIYADYGLINADHAPYIDGNTATYERRQNELIREIDALKKEVKRLESENKTLFNRVNSSVVDMDKSDNKSDKSALKTFEATFYTAFCPTGCTGVTATGVDVRNTIYHAGKRIIAVDPNVIPLGSLVRVTLKDGTSFEATAQDTGGAIKGNRIDILVDNRDEAYRLGRQSVKVEILK